MPSADTGGRGSRRLKGGVPAFQESLALGFFCACMLLCVLMGQSILYALGIGLVIFLFYGRSKGVSWRDLAQMSAEGVWGVRQILVIFLLIGSLTALWRGAGTIPMIVCWASRLLRPSSFLVMTFLLNCLVSVLTGTALGTAATMGVICAAIGTAMQVDISLVGGAVLSGIYFGDRCSPMSTSASLVAGLTNTDLFQNIRQMLRSAIVPFGAACAMYTLMGVFFTQDQQAPDLETLFGQEFTLHWVEFLPVAVVLVLSLLRVNVKITMTFSSITAMLICVLVQHTAITALPRLLLTGYHAANQEVAALMNGGGISSMMKVMGIVCLSATYSGIAQKTPLLAPAKQMIHALSRRAGPYPTALFTSIAAGMLTCNQALTIMLTYQLCDEVEKDKEMLALHLADTAVVVAPMVPWSIACALPLASINGPSTCVLFAFFLYLLPAWKFVQAARTHH